MALNGPMAVGVISSRCARNCLSKSDLASSKLSIMYLVLFVVQRGYPIVPSASHFSHFTASPAAIRSGPSSSTQALEPCTQIGFEKVAHAFAEFRIDVIVPLKGGEGGSVGGAVQPSDWRAWVKRPAMTRARWSAQKAGPADQQAAVGDWACQRQGEKALFRDVERAAVLF